MSSSNSNSTTINNNIPPNRERITEGSVSMLYPKDDVVFYNPVQVQNRDLSLIMIELYAERFYKRMVLSRKKKELIKEEKEEKKKNMKTNVDGDTTTCGSNSKQSSNIESKLKDFEQSIDWKSFFQSNLHTTKQDKNEHSNDDDITSSTTQHLPKNYQQIQGIRILDALAASGLRSLRYYKELNPSLIHSVSINDLDPAAVDLARENIEFNGLTHALVSDTDDTEGQQKDTTSTSTAKPKLYIHNEDATTLMYLSRRKPNRSNPAKPSTTPTSSSPSSSSKLPIFTQYDVIDLDPYGTVAPFLDSALQSICDGGLLAITSTDMKTLGGSQPDTCYARYGSIPINKSKYLQEFALRILLCDIAKRAAIYGRSIKPILSIGMNFYVRVFVEVYSHGPSVKTLSCNIGTVYQSVHCPSYHIVPNGQCSSRNQHVIQPTRAPGLERCEETGCGFKAAGPIWLGPLHDNDVVLDAIGRLDDWMDEHNPKKKMRPKKDDCHYDIDDDDDAHDDENNNSSEWREFEYVKMGKELHGLLTMVSEELNDSPLYYNLPDLCHTLGCSTPPLQKFKAALINAGYRVSGYHKEPQAIKTDAPNEVVWDILREWCKDNPPKKNSKKKENKLKKRRKKNGNHGENHMIENKSKGEGENENVTTNGEGNDKNDNQDADNIIENKPTMTTSEKILAKEIKTKVDFTIPDQLKDKKKVCRFPMNPQAHWGPKKAASGYKRKLDETEEQGKQ